MKKNEAPMSPEEIAASLEHVAKAKTPFARVVRMTPKERMRSAKMRRGGPQVVPTIAHIATRFAVVAPGSSIEAMEADLAHAQSLESLLGALSALHETVRDEYLRAKSSSWETALVTYGMLKHAAKANPSLANELAPVTHWFRRAPSDRSS